MRSIGYIILMSAVCLILTSCKTTEKFNLYSPVEGTLYLPSAMDEPYAVLSAMNSAKVEVPSDMYLGYVLVKDRQSGLEIPVGINVHDRSTFGTRTGLGVGMALTGIGCGTFITGIVMAAAGGDDMSETGGIIAGGGAVALGIGMAVGMPAEKRLKQLSYRYRFAYDKNQDIYASGLSTRLLREDAPKEGTHDTDTPKRGKAHSGDLLTPALTSTRVNKSRKDAGKSVAGIYIGSGTLMTGNKVEEKYGDIQVLIERVDKTHVRVTVKESGEDYFESPIVYEVSSNGQNGYELVIPDLPEASIEISNHGALKFMHRKVNIDNEIFTLTISGVKN